MNESQTRKEIIDNRLKQAGWIVSDRTQVIEEFDIVVWAGDIKKGMLPLKDHISKKSYDKINNLKMSPSFISAHIIIEKNLDDIADKLDCSANVLASSRDILFDVDGKNFDKKFLIYGSVPTLLRPDANLIRYSKERY